MKPSHAFAFVLLIAILVWSIAAFSIRHTPIKACVQVSQDGSMTTYPPLKGYCVPQPRPKSSEATQ